MKYKIPLRDDHGNLLEVVQQTPNKGNKFPTVILVSGFGVDLHEYGYFDEISDLLVKNGIQTIRFSFAGTGKSEGDFTQMTLEDQAVQLRIVVDQTLKDRYTDNKRLAVMAQSFGTATVVAALPLVGIKTYLFTSSIAHPYDSLSKYFKQERGFNPSGISQRIRSDKRKTLIGPQFWPSISDIDLVKKINLITSPILFIHGSKDRRVKYWEAQEYYEVVQAKKRFLLIENAGHGFIGKYRIKVLDVIRDWFLETLV